MSKNYKDIINNLKEFIELSFNRTIINKDLEIDNKVYSNNHKKTHDEEIETNICIDWIQKTKIYYVDYAFSNEKVIFFKYVDESNRENYGNYLIYSSYEKVNFSNDFKIFVKDVDLNLGMFLSLFEKPEWYPLINTIISEDAVTDIIDIPYSENQVNYDFHQILTLFSSINVFKIKEDFLDSDYELNDIENFKYRLLGIIKLTKLSNINSIMGYFTNETIACYRSIFIDDIKHFPYENLYLSLNHNSPKYIFLEIYRAIEQLYPIIYCYNLKKNFSITEKDLFKINNYIEQNLGWKHKERDAITEIFEHMKKFAINKVFLDELESYKITFLTKETKISNWIYDIRNTSVHLRFHDSTENTNLTEQDIKKILNKDVIIKNLVNLLSNIYKEIFD